MKFVDEVSIYVKSGHGGAGAVSFRREKFVPRGGPDGGDGGKGGDIIFRVNPQLSSLLDLRFRKNYIAPNGQPGGAQNSFGADGQDLYIDVPRGTIIKNSKGEVIADMSGEVQELVLFKGGRGGKGNAFFKTSVNQAPTHAQPGEDGTGDQLHLELKLLADVGIIGYPNAGKSTLISRMSAATPKVADYPFTTLIPHLGVVSMGQGVNYVVADIPGLIPGAHEGAGLGTRFLKHIERTRCFIHLIDASEFSTRDPLQDYRDINHELEMYDKLHSDKPDFVPLRKRPQWVVLNKIDATPEARVEELKYRFQKDENITVRTLSAVCGHGVKDLTYEIGRYLLEKGNDQEENNKRDSEENQSSDQKGGRPQAEDRSFWG